VRTAVDSVYVVGEAEDDLGILVVVLKGDLNVKLPVGYVTFAFEVDRLIVERRFATVEVLDKFGDAAL